MSKLVQMAAAALLCALAGPFVSRAPAQYSQQGEWETEINEATWKVEAEHAILLKKNGKVLYFDHWNDSPNARVFDPSDQTFTDAALPDRINCAGHSQLADGRIVFVGGHIRYQNNRTWIFDPDQMDPPNDPWSRVDDMFDDNGQAAQRWYATCTTLGDGKVLVTAGLDPDEPNDPALIPVVFDAAAAPGQQYSWLADDASLNLKWYPFMFQISSGKVFEAGGNSLTGLPMQSRNLNIALSQWTDVGDEYVLHGVTAVMYRPDRVMKGGGAAGRKRMFTIDVSPGSEPDWVEVDAMDYGRSYFYLIGMPDGRILSINGDNGTPQDPAAVLVPEWYDPDLANPVWESLAQMSSARMLHSTALLLSDARVLVAGGDVDGGQKTAQIFRPPYLFTGDVPPLYIGDPGVNVRPVIGPSTPDVIYYNTSFDVETTDAASITKVSLVRLGAATHSFDQDQRFVPLEFTAGFGTVTAAAPAHGFIAPPGYYMLFILKDGDRAGIKYPSLAKIIKVGPKP